ncbi:hypothetical protein IAG25_40140 [Caballeronia sp. EK]|uniref:hypothetical protein n=1 Tax=Caballeronia sp. EK TaxID=2767469 RepID=UPI0016564FA5|nr:hypothetical protein [Caballeronia sp. EK]MBC8642968.1 hypothetical protein [Caballeronia sp. EK]
MRSSTCLPQQRRTFLGAYDDTGNTSPRAHAVTPSARFAEHKKQEEEREAKRNADEAAAAQQTSEPVSIVSAPMQPAPIPTRVAPVIAAPSGAPTPRLGQINERLAPITMTADGLASLGFAHAATDKSAKLYHEADFARICDALIRHIVESALSVEVSE